MDGLGGSVEDRSVYGVENSSMFLECSPKSQRALIYWQLQGPNDERKHEVRTAGKGSERKKVCHEQWNKCLTFCVSFPIPNTNFTKKEYHVVHHRLHHQICFPYNN